MAMQLLKRKVTLGQRLGLGLVNMAKQQLAGKKLKLKKRMWTPYSKHEKQWLALCFSVFTYVHMFHCNKLRILQVQMICDQENYAIKTHGYQNESLIPLRLKIARSSKDLVSGYCLLLCCLC